MSEKPDQFKGHTPGPWRVANGVQIRSHRDQIAKVWMMRNGEGNANAALIAAAPSLLADNERLTADNERLRDELRQSGIDHTRAEVERLREALKSIAANACCDRCQEAALVAKAALKEPPR